MSALCIVAVSVGNSRTAVAGFDSSVDPAGMALAPASSVRLANDDLDGIAAAVRDAWEPIADREGAAILVASVNEPVAARLRSRLVGTLDAEILRVGEEVPIPIGTQLDPETITGVDRLLNAAAAFRLFKSACVVVDAGTAVTVDFVDGAGTFQGGAIAPGAAMQLNAMHEHTSALPQLSFAAPDAETFGKNTQQAMLHGVYDGIRGLVWRLVEQYATAYGAFPKVIATGGDAAILFAGDELVDRVLPDLTLSGIAAAAIAVGLGDGADGGAGGRAADGAGDDDDDL